MLHLECAHAGDGLFSDDPVVHAVASPRSLGLLLLPSINPAEAAVIVMAETLEVIERGHFEVGTRQRRREFFANRVEDADASQFLGTFGPQFLGSRRTF